MTNRIFLNFWLLIAFGLVTVAFSSCDKDEKENPSEPDLPEAIVVTDIRLDKTDLTLLINEEYALTATIQPDNATNKTVTWTSSDKSIATVDNNGKITAVAEGTVIITAKAGDKTTTCTVGITATPDYPTTDEGVLIGTTTWATRNVSIPGHFTVNPEDPGMFYQWNRKAGWSSKDPKINSNNETYWNMNDESGSIWSVAANPCPVGWRVPTSDELSSLEGAGTWTTNWKGTGVNGVVFGSGNNTVFLPAASSRDFSGRLSSDQVGTNGRYWSSTPHTFNNSRAYYLSFRSGEIDAGFDAYRSSGFCVRCVLAEE